MNRRRFRSAPKELLFWDRADAGTIVTTQATVANAQGVVVADPSVFLVSPGGFVDQRWTLRRQILDVESSLTVAVAGGTALSFIMRLGVYLSGNSEATRDPSMTTSQDLLVDWMDLWDDAWPVGSQGAGTTLSLNTTTRRVSHRNVGVQRKVDADQNVVLAQRFLVGFGGTLPTTFTVTSRVWVSNLWQRTMRRR